MCITRRTAARPGKRTRASSHASGTPKRIDNPVDHNEHLIDSFKASSASDECNSDHASPHGARHNRPMNGSAKNTIATTASARRRERQTPPTTTAVTLRPGAHCLRESVLGEDRLARGTGDEADEAGRGRRVLGGFRHRDRVGGDDVDVVGNGDADRFVACRLDIGRVDDACVGFVEGHLVHDRLHVGFEALRRDGDLGLVEHLFRVRADRNLWRSSHVDQARLREVGDAGDALRVALGRDDLQLVGCERHRWGGGARAARRGDLVHVGGVGRCEHVGWRTLIDLGGERRRSGEAEGHLHARIRGFERGADLFERVGQRCGRQHRDIAGHLRHRRRIGDGELVDESSPQPAPTRPKSARRRRRYRDGGLRISDTLVRS